MNSTTTTEQPWTLDIHGMAALLGISDDLAYKLVHIEGFPSFRLGRKILIDRRKLSDWLDNQVQGQIPVWR